MEHGDFFSKILQIPLYRENRKNDKKIPELINQLRCYLPFNPLELELNSII